MPAKDSTIEQTRKLFKPPQESDFTVIDKANWEKIKQTEIKRGKDLGKIKEKIVERSEMFGVAKE